MLAIPYFYQTTIFGKKKSNEFFFYLPMESFHGAEICKLGKIFSNCGLYRDDGLGVIGLAKPVVYDRTRKQVFKVMSDKVSKLL